MRTLARQGRDRRLSALVAFLALALGTGIARAGEFAPEVQGRIDAAQAAGLPVEPMLAKAREGQAKGVDPARVALVLDGLAGDLAEARGLVDLDAPDADALVAAAGLALAAGASPAAVRSVGTLPAELRGRALVSLADLLSLHVPEGDAVVLISDAARSADPAQTVARLAAATAGLVAGGLSPESAAASVRAQTQGRGRGNAGGNGNGNANAGAHGNSSNAGGNGNGNSSNAGGNGNGNSGNAGGNGNGKKGALAR